MLQETDAKSLHTAIVSYTACVCLGHTQSASLQSIVASHTQSCIPQSPAAKNAVQVSSNFNICG